MNPVVVASDIAEDKDVENGHKHGVGRLADDVIPDLTETEGTPDDCGDGDADALPKVMKFPSRHSAYRVSDCAVK